MSQFQTIEREVRSIFRSLRKESIASEDYKVILLLLSLVKDGILNKDSYEYIKDVDSLILDNVKASSEELQGVYLPIYDVFRPSLKRFGNSAAYQVLVAFHQFDTVFISENFLVIFDGILFRIARSRGTFLGDYLTPSAITAYIESITELPENSSVFNPFGGLGSFGLFLKGGNKYLGQEIDKVVWAIGTLRIRGHEYSHNAKFVCTNSLLEWPNGQRFDLVVSNLPYRVRFENSKREFLKEYDSIENYFIKQGLNVLKDTGKLVVLSIVSAFSSNRNADLNKYLVDNDFIESVIRLPSKLDDYMSNPMIIIILSKKKRIPGKIRFVESDSLSRSFETSALVRGDKSFNSHMYSISVREKYVENRKVAASNYSLNVARYFLEKVEGVLLKSILEPINPVKFEGLRDEKLLTFDKLKNEKNHFTLNTSNLPSWKSTVKDELKPFDSYWELSESCLLVSMRTLSERSRSVNAAFFEYVGQPLVISRSSGIIAFRTNSKIVDYSYLVNELSAEYVKNQINAYSEGTLLGNIRTSDFLQIVIRLPSIDEQRARVQGIRELSSKIKQLQDELSALEQGKERSTYNEFASLKHTLGAPRQNILDWADNLHHFLIQKPSGFTELNSSFKEFYELDMLGALSEIKSDISFMTSVLEKGENGFVMKDYQNTITSLSEINNHFNRLSSNGFKFKLKKMLLNSEADLKSKGIEVNETLLKTLLDNILVNADKHGFNGHGQGNEVSIELKELEDFLYVEIKNNGKSFPPNFDRSKFITKFSTENSTLGSGIGGYDIHRIACHFNNPDWELVLDDDPIYAVKFIFKFPIKLKI